MDIFCVLVTMDILGMELFAKVNRHLLILGINLTYKSVSYYSNKQNLRMVNLYGQKISEVLTELALFVLSFKTWMNVLYLLTIVTKMQTALTLMDLSCVLATMDILEMEHFVKVY